MSLQCARPSFIIVIIYTFFILNNCYTTAVFMSADLSSFIKYVIHLLDLTFDLAVLTLTYKILYGLYLGNRKV